MLSAVSAPSVLAATSSTSSAVSFVAGVVGGIVAGIVLYLLVYRYSARHLSEVRVEEASELLKRLRQQQTSFVCALPTGIMVGFVFPATSHLSTGPLLLVVHLMGAAMIGVSIVGVAWLSPRLRAVRNTAVGCLAALRVVKTMDNDVRSLREARGLTQAQLGVALGVSRQSINSIEKGKYDPSLPLAIAIARYFETTVEEIFHV